MTEIYKAEFPHGVVVNEGDTLIVKIDPSSEEPMLWEIHRKEDPWILEGTLTQRGVMRDASHFSVPYASDWLHNKLANFDFGTKVKITLEVVEAES